MIVVCGPVDPAAIRGDRTVGIAELAARNGAPVQLVAIVPEGSRGDRLALRLAASGIGHAALQRGPTRRLEAADLDLALRYLPEVRVIVVVEVEPDVIAGAAAGAAFAGAGLIVVAAAGAAVPDAVEGSGSTIVLAAPATDPDQAFAGFVAALASRLEAGEVAADAWNSTLGSLAVDPVR